MEWIIVAAVAVILVLMAARSARKMNQTSVPAPQPAPVAKAKTTSAPVSVANTAGIPEETVAVISAAIAAYMQKSAPGVSYAVTGITRSLNARPVWGFAGMRQNMRPF